MYGSARLMRTIYSQSVLILKIVRYNPCGLCCYRYAEYQYVCSTDQIEAKQCFGDIDMFQLFDLVPEHSYLPHIAFTLLESARIQPALPVGAVSNSLLGLCVLLMLHWSRPRILTS